MANLTVNSVTGEVEDEYDAVTTFVKDHPIITAGLVVVALLALFGKPKGLSFGG